MRLLGTTGKAACLAAATLAAAGAWESTALAKTECGPRDELITTQTIRQETAAGSEVTEPLGAGAYRVTKCDTRGALRESMTVVPIPDPDIGKVFVPIEKVTPTSSVFLTYGDPADPQWVNEWRRARNEVRATVIPPTRGKAAPDDYISPMRSRALSPRSGVQSFQYGDPNETSAACADASFSRNDGAWLFYGYNWYLKASDFGNSPTTNNALLAGKRAWNDLYNDCGLPDNNYFTAYYQGTTSAGWSRDDTISVVDKGNMSNVQCPGALACVSNQYGTFPWYASTDTRFSSSVSWTNTGAAGAYDYRNVMTHEAGHSVGLRDLYDRGGPLTMYYAVAMRETKKRTLGLGDIRGIYTVQP